jgi:hypothetical protein
MQTILVSMSDPPALQAGRSKGYLDRVRPVESRFSGIVSVVAVQGEMANICQDHEYEAHAERSDDRGFQ